MSHAQDDYDHLRESADQSRDPFSYHDGAWWFANEVWSDWIGPYTTEELARAELEKYIYSELDGPVRCTIPVGPEERCGDPAVAEFRPVGDSEPRCFKHIPTAQALPLQQLMLITDRYWVSGPEGRLYF